MTTKAVHTASTPSEKFRAAAATYAERGITAVPTVKDEDGIAKVPALDYYPRLKPTNNTAHDWSKAAGLGIVLGKPSGCLAVIDIDDTGLAEFLLRRLSQQAHPPLMVTTARNRLHVYVQEPEPSRSVDLEVRYSGRRCLVQLLAAACQAAAPPTPGYQWADPKAQPLFGSVAAVWRRISLDHGLPYRVAIPYSFLRRERSRGPTTAQVREAAR